MPLSFWKRMRRCHLHNHKACVLFIDLVKDYNTVNQELLWKVLERFGVPPQMIKVLQKLYISVTYHMNVAGKEEIL
jgi:hypothetical protein